MIDLKRSFPPISRRVILMLLTICLVTTDCALIKSKKDIDTSLESTVIVGRVRTSVSGSGPIVVAAFSVDEGSKIAHYTVLHESGEYELAVDRGNYLVFAYWDKNSNLVYEEGEPAGQHGEAKMVRAQSIGVVFDIDVDIPEGNQPIAIPYGTKITSVRPEKLYSRQAGDITDLDDERFSGENGLKGFWEPISFFKEIGGNIYFLEEYDHEKTPILFIHGATGTPRGWRYFVDHIDRTRFQPWFFYYPTGARIESMSYLLLWKLSNLQAKYQFDEIYITAHSMGGLVARSFIVNYGRQFPCVKLFISLATPWGGDRMAGLGVQQSPVVIPSWIDMQPEGQFIKALYRMTMPESVSFYLFYGYKGSRSPFRRNNDGTVTLSSLLDRRPQSEAEMSYAFNEDHTSILFSEEVLAQYNAILDAFDEKQSGSIQSSGGYIKPHFTYDYNVQGAGPRHTLILRPIGKKDTETVIFLDDEDNGKILGPFPTGDYVASLVTLAAKPEKNEIPVSIESNNTNDLNFVLMPDGVIRGCVTASLQAEDKSMGMPDYIYRLSDKEIKIKSITLKGIEFYRELTPIDGKVTVYDDFLNHQYLISRADFCIDTCFGFFGLSAGDYRLTINAKGYIPIERKYTVRPGKPQYFRITELKPKD